MRLRNSRGANNLAPPVPGFQEQQQSRTNEQTNIKSSFEKYDEKSLGIFLVGGKSPTITDHAVAGNGSRQRHGVGIVYTRILCSILLKSFAVLVESFFALIVSDFWSQPHARLHVTALLLIRIAT